MPFHQCTRLPVYVHLLKNTCRQHSTCYVTSWPVPLNRTSLIFYSWGLNPQQGYVCMCFISGTLKCEQQLQCLEIHAFSQSMSCFTLKQSWCMVRNCWLPMVKACIQYKCKLQWNSPSSLDYRLLPHEQTLSYSSSMELSSKCADCLCLRFSFRNIVSAIFKCLHQDQIAIVLYFRPTMYHYLHFYSMSNHILIATY